MEMRWQETHGVFFYALLVAYGHKINVSCKTECSGKHDFFTSFVKKSSFDDDRSALCTCFTWEITPLSENGLLCENMYF